MTPRRPSVVFLILLRLPYAVGAILIAWLVWSLSGCASRSTAPFPALPPGKPLTTAERDALFYHWPEAAPVLARGSVTDQAINPQPSTINLAWYQPGTCLGWRIETSNDLRTWTTNKTLWCEYIFRDRSITTTVAVTSPAFFRVAAFNGR